MRSARVFLLLTIGLTPLAPAIGQAEGLRLSGSTMNRGSLFKSQTALLDGRLAKQYENSGRLKPNADKGTDATAPQYSGTYNGAHLKVARAAAQKY